MRAREGGIVRGKGRIVIALVIAAISLFMYFGRSSQNPVTGESQNVGDMTHEQEVALRLQAAPEMAQQFGGLSQDAQATQIVKDVCSRLLSRSQARAATEYYRFDCHLLALPSPKREENQTCAMCFAITPYSFRHEPTRDVFR